MSGYEKSPDYGGGGPVNWRRVAMLLGWALCLVGAAAIGMSWR